MCAKVPVLSIKINLYYYDEMDEDPDEVKNEAKYIIYTVASFLRTSQQRIASHI
jgi:hypothetical protein